LILPRTDEKIKAYWFSLPDMGTLSKDLAAARQEVITTIKKTQYKEMLSKELLAKHLKKAPLPIRWVVADMIGGGLLNSTITTSGSLLQLPQQ
jgi:hypothetical protein